MYLSKLKIFGFKSFAQKVEVHFPGNGLTAVVGPNGCGKSNIVDAIRWVMGEQRASQLRSSKMQDVIFSGTEDRPAQNMAEVSLIINNDRGLLPSDFSEIQITRRAYRNGDTEYLLNNQECRLRDIHNLFYDTGMGAASYSLMEQRMIDAILSDKAEDRRVLFEEAAGVSKYKQQRKETVRQLEKVGQDMERIEDNLKHVRSSVRQHEKQVQRAEEWRQVRTRFRSLELSMTLDKYLENKEHLGIFISSRSQIESDRNRMQTRLAELETRIAEKKLSISADEDVYRALESDVAQRNKDISAINAEYSVQKSRLENLTANIERFQQEIAKSSEQILQLESRREDLETLLAQAEEGESSELTRDVERIEESCLVLRDQVEDLRNRKRELTLQHRQSLESVVKLRGRWDRVEGELDQVAKQIEGTLKDQGVAESQSQEIQTDIQRQNQRLEQILSEKSKQQESILVLQERLLEMRDRLQEAKNEEREWDSKLISLRSRLQVLEQMEASGSGIEGGTRWILDRYSKDLQGILGDQLQVQNHTALVEYCLGESLQSILLNSHEQAESLLGALESAQAGRVSLLLPGLNHQSSLERVDAPGVIGPVLDFVQCPDQWLPVLQKLLNSWILVQDFTVAMQLAQQHSQKDLWFVAPGGRAVHTSGMVRGGAGEGSGILSRRQELDESRKALDTLEEQKALATEHRITAEGRVSEIEDQMKSIRDEEFTLNRAEQDLRSGIKVLDARLQSLQAQINRFASVRQGLEQRQVSLQQERQGDAELQAAESALQRLESELERDSSVLEEQEMQLRSQEDDLRELRNKEMEARSKLKHASSQIQSLMEQERLHQSICQGRRLEIEKLEVESAQLTESLDALANLIELRSEELSQVEAKRDVAKEHYDVLSGDIDTWHDEVRAINTELRDKDSQNHDILRRIDALQLNQDRYKERMFEAWEFDLENPGDFTRVDYDEKDSMREVRDLKEQLKKIGPVSASVMEDYEKEKANLADVEKQFDDLDKARSSLARTIEKLDRIARERFLETFRQIQKNFQDVFSSLMVGGEGRLTLQEDVDPLEAEIEVNARPTGKKMRGVRALSGGERALTATSLLFALYMVKPSPYCILDEVDGPLDDANIGRFVQLLRRFSRQTQFIVVTHNKRTMAACDMLYGVTQEVKGISRIASVELNEAQDLVK